MATWSGFSSLCLGMEWLCSLFLYSLSTQEMEITYDYTECMINKYKHGQGCKGMRIIHNR